MDRTIWAVAARGTVRAMPVLAPLAAVLALALLAIGAPWWAGVPLAFALGLAYGPLVRRWKRVRS